MKLLGLTQLGPYNKTGQTKDPHRLSVNRAEPDVRGSDQRGLLTICHIHNDGLVEGCCGRTQPWQKLKAETGISVTKVCWLK